MRIFLVFCCFHSIDSNSNDELQKQQNSQKMAHSQEVMDEQDKELDRLLVESTKELAEAKELNQIRKRKRLAEE